MKNLRFKLTQWLLILTAVFWANKEVNAQCIPPEVLTQGLCVNSPIQFKNMAAGASNIVWDFAGTVVNNENDPVFSFPTSGTFQVTLSYTDAGGNPCSRTIDVIIIPRPIVDIEIVTPTVQCYAGNKFTVIDKSLAAPGSTIKRVKYVAAGLQIEQFNPTMPFSFDFSTADPGGGYYSIDVEVEDANGCITNVTLQDIVEVKPSLGLNFTSNKPQGCDSTLMTITNNSLISLGAISSFSWDFGDGETNTTDWGPQIQHMYYLEGPNLGQFNACLTVTDTTGCSETFCFTGSATNLKIGAEIIPDKDSACMSDNTIAFQLVPGLPTGATGFLWVFGDPDTGPMNFYDGSPISSEHVFSKPGPFLVNYNYFHPICGAKTIHKQVVLLGPVSAIPGPGIPINQRYQCRSEDTVFFPNESKFFHNDRKFFDDAYSYFHDSLNMWIYNFDSTAQTLTGEEDSLPNRGKDCVFRVWDFDDDYAPRCTTDANPVYTQKAEFNNLHFAPDPVTGLYPKNTYYPNGDWVNCRYSLDSLPKHMYTDWDTIYWDSFYLTNRPLQKTITVLDSISPQLSDTGCYRIMVDTTDAAEHRKQFFLQIPRCYNVRLYHEDTCHDYHCYNEAITQISIMKPRSTGLRKEGRYCFGGPPTYGVTFNLDPGTRPGCTSTEAYINPDTALNPNNWINYLPGGLTGTYQAPSPIMPYAISGPYPNKLFMAYPNPGSIKDTLTGYAHVGLIIGNGIGTNKCYDTTYYEKFIKFPVIDADVKILIPDPVPGYTNLYKVCIGDSLVMQVTRQNKTVPWDADQISYSFSRIAPSDVEEGGRYPFYSYVIFENYEWFLNQSTIAQSDTTIIYTPNVQIGDYDFYEKDDTIWYNNNTQFEIAAADTLVLNGNNIVSYKAGETIRFLENYLNRTVVRTYGNNSQTLLTERFKIGTVERWISEPDISQVYEILDPAFEGLGYILSSLTPKEVNDVFIAGCIDTTGLGDFIQYDITPIDRTSIHYRDTTIFSLDTYLNDSADYMDNAYSFIAEENGIFNLDFLIRSRIGGCIDRKGHRVIVGFYNKLTVSDSVICKESEITGTPFFRYWHIDPPNNPSIPSWRDAVNYWNDREAEAGQPNKEGFTKWDWSDRDDDPNNPNTIFAPNTSGTNPYGTYSYFPVELGGSGTNKIYYNDSGIYKLRVAASDSTGCEDTLTQNIYVTRLLPKFGFKDTLNACVFIVTFLDSTKLVDPCLDALGRPCDEIREWYIDWDDGKKPDLFNKQTYPPNLGFTIGHNYTKTGTFNIKFRVKTDLGCEDSFTRVFIIDGPSPTLSLDRYEICSGDSIKFYNVSNRQTNTSQYIWAFGDGKGRSEIAPNHADSFYHTYEYYGPSIDTIYNAYLTMYDSVAGRFCGFAFPDTTGGSEPKIEIRVKAKSPVHIFADKDTICPNDIVTFRLHSDSTFTQQVDPDYLNFFWNFDAQNGLNDTVTTTARTVSKQFPNVGNYMITTDGIFDPNINKCPSSDTVYVFVDDVKADFEIDSTKSPEFCFTNTSSNSVKNEWGFYHTTDIPTTGEPFKFVEENNEERICRNFFDSLGTWFVCLAVENSGGCLDTICKPITFNRKIQVPNVFTPPILGKTGDNLNDVYDIPIAGHDMYELVIRNRWGDIVFKSDDSEYDWNGQVNNDGATCPDGEYIYTLKYRFKGTETIEEVSGIVVLIRQR